MKINKGATLEHSELGKVKVIETGFSFVGDRVVRVNVLEDNSYKTVLKESLSEIPMTKEEMFDFILMNNVEISLDGGWYTKVDEEGNPGERFQNKYKVSINGSGMCGFDLEGAIQYYRDNLVKE